MASAKSSFCLATNALAVVVLAGCATAGGLPPGSSIDEARNVAFGPTGEYALPDGGTRLEFAQGQFGKQTYMLDFNREGKLTSSQQVLTERNLATIGPGMSANELLTRFGRPASTFGVRYHNQRIWNYRYADGDCVWVQVSVSQDTQLVEQAGIGTDPICDGPNDRE